MSDGFSNGGMRQRGLSLLELMVALLIAGLLALGIVQIFGASRVTYQTQEGLSRVQESGRYATQFLQRQLRMVGYMGCGSDSERFSQVSFVNHLATYSATVPGGDAVDPKYRFQRPIEAFASTAVPAGFLDHAPLGGDVLVLRVLGEDSVPALTINAANNSYNQLDATVASPTADVFEGNAGAAVLYALQSCRSIDIFAGALAADKVTAQGNVAPNQYLDPTVTNCGAGGCPWDFRISNAFLNAPPASTGGLQLNAEIHRAEFYAFYVATSTTNSNVSSLYVRRFSRSGTDLGPSEELAEGVESLKFSFGVDTDPTPDGQINEYRSAADIEGASGGTEPGRDNAWRQVVSVRVGMLVRSPDRAAIGPTADGTPRTYKVLGETVTPTTGDDGYVRQVYETTVALRNRIFNS